MANFAVILPAAGMSSRFSAQKRKKPFVELKGRPVWVRAAEIFLSRDDVSQVLLVVSREDMEWVKEKFRANLAFMNVEIVEGGAERFESVQNALARVKTDVDFVAVHDAARPLLVKEWVDTLFVQAEKSGAVIPAVPASDTLKRVGPNHTILETIPRDGLWRAQTPQVFGRQLLMDAFARRGSLRATDEAQLVENLGHPVTIVEGWPMNIKITTFADFKMAEALVDALPRPKTFGRLHPFADESPRLL
ncbi:MAG TPA: 2-C-methyl-D-erythritol 4-phosphate cytidylyltransferase [Planctomycetaceae bacterium]|jgi:2-C-methyl-D-erythritol 4-phosphate cytidylyltransferase|nr:2-C-methyl-D-erythritol 4-phosphate cytidylyltransferase [Planctomycetaceae bacterium]